MSVHTGCVKKNFSPRHACCVCIPLALLALYAIVVEQPTPAPRGEINMEAAGVVPAPWWQSFHDRRTIYLQPMCGLGNQLVSISSALTVARRERVNLKIVFEAWDDPANEVLWSDMFSNPPIDHRDPFPDGSFLYYNTTSEVFDLGLFIKANGMKMTWRHIKNKFIQQPNGEHSVCAPMCLWQEGSFPSDEAWFYKLLEPTAAITDMIHTFKRSVDWERHQWVGVHIRRGDRIRDLTSYLKENKNSTARELLPLDNYVSAMKSVSSILPGHFFPSSPEVHNFLLRFESLNFDGMDIRFFLATDDPEAAKYIKSFFPHGSVVSYEHTGDLSSVQRAQNAVADMFLLASCEALIGTPTSSFSLAAKLIGSGLYFEPELFASKP